MTGTSPSDAHPNRPRSWGVGLHYGPTDISMPIVALAREAQARGFSAMFVPEHTHIPVARTTPYPGGSPMPDRYRRLLDPLVALSFVAAETDMVVGTCVALPAEHDPIAYAKAAATLDHLSGGRYVMGVGFGWNEDEAADHGFPGRDRRAVAIEKVAAIKELWTKDVASYQGTHVDLSPSWSWPKPFQDPHPPVLLGGRATSATFKRIVSWADGWIPMSMDNSATLAEDLRRLRALWAEAGRSPEQPYVAVMQQPEPAARMSELLTLYRSLGVNRVLVDVPSEGPEVLVPMLDALAPAVQSATSLPPRHEKGAP